MSKLFISICLLTTIANMNLFERNERDAVCPQGGCIHRPPAEEYYPLPAPYEGTSELPS